MYTSWGIRRCSRKIQPNLNTCMKNIYWTREYVHNPRRNSVENKANGLESHLLTPFWPRKLRRQSVPRTVRMTLSSDFFRGKQRQANFVSQKSFPARWEVYFYERIGDAQPFKADKLFVRSLPLKSLQEVPFFSRLDLYFIRSFRRVTCSLVMSWAHYASHSYYPCSTHPAPLIFPLARFLWVFA